MGREDIRDAKKPYATTNIYNPGAQPPVVPLYTNPLQIGKLLTVRELVVHVTNPTFCANQIWRLY